MPSPTFQATSVAALLAAALSLGLAGAASADQSTATIRGQAVNGQSLNDTQTGGVLFGATASQFITDNHGNPLAFQQITASTRSTFDSSVIAFTQAVNALSPIGNAGTSIALTDATATFADSITINGAPDTVGRTVRLSGTLILDNDPPQHTQQFSQSGAAAGANMINEVGVHVSGSGVQSGVYGGTLFGAFDSTFAPGHVDTITDPTINAIGFQMDVVIGQATPVFFTLEEISNSILADPNGRAAELATLVDAYTLRWGNDLQFSLLDSHGQDTHRQLRGLSVDSSTGFNFFDGVTSGSGVPEPTAWSLMIAGFGGVGATLRRRRTVLAA